MFKQILVQTREDETRVAVFEDEQLVEIYLERALNQRLVGNIYKGKVENVLPGMQAAFVDIGLEKNAFLYVEDAISNNFDNEYESKDFAKPNIRDVVKEGQELVVQISKEPVGTKGARITTQITLPGRFLVLMPTVDYIGISRRIEDEEERNRLKSIVEDIKTQNMGVIIRTAAEGAAKEDLEHDLLTLTQIWKKIKQRGDNSSAPSLIHKDVELVQRILRDLFTEDVNRLIIDSKVVYEKVLDFLDATMPQFKLRVFLKENEDLFSKYNVDLEINKALKRKVWLKSGGYLVFDQTEALTAIDVNTGKYVGTTDLADTVLKTNLEATYEIARNIRLRNIGGIIIVDFIDMVNHDHQALVLKQLEDCLKRDKTRVHILGITSLGLVEMTRKKSRQSLTSVLERTCPCCEGKGKILSEETISLKITHELAEISTRTSANVLLVEAHPSVASILIGSSGEDLKKIEYKLGKEIYIKGKETLHFTSYEIKSIHSPQTASSNTIPVEEGQIIKLLVEEEHDGFTYDGIGRIYGYVIQIEDGAKLLGNTVLVEINKVFKTYARASIIKD